MSNLKKDKMTNCASGNYFIWSKDNQESAVSKWIARKKLKMFLIRPSAAFWRKVNNDGYSYRNLKLKKWLLAIVLLRAHIFFLKRRKKEK